MLPGDVHNTVALAPLCIPLIIKYDNGLLADRIQQMQDHMKKMHKRRRLTGIPTKSQHQLLPVTCRLRTDEAPLLGLGYLLSQHANHASIMLELCEDDGGDTPGDEDDDNCHHHHQQPYSRVITEELSQ